MIPSYFTPFLCTLCTSPNLFRPSFGTYPHVLVGRDPLVDEFDDTFDGLFDPTGLTMLLSGQRGMGKTVLLDAYARAARAAGWLVISDASSDGLLDRLGRDHLPRLLQMHADQSHAKLTSGSISLGPLGAGGGWDDRYPAESTLRSQIAELTDALRPSGRGLVVTVDEIQSAALEELRKLGEIAKRMGVTAQYAGEYRRRLIRDGIIEPAGHGKVRFTIPYTADHLREHAAHDALEGLADENP
ncbi:MAG TPA: AAA family ATPase [Candidatus Brachybacterium merdavium]|uniref:AAA family ATPase n=1 Tax=Candidatus Brachybacterium merdavium TaxID=2838513 RepID=A0A9D2RP88_9MICO|nr:AAA family ATPase [Candidatus Brachybacterium merdavium]